MRMLSEQAGSKLRILPVDMDTLSDEEFMHYINELRGNRGKTVRKATAKDGSSTSKTRKPPAPKALDSIDDDLKIA